MLLEFGVPKLCRLAQLLLLAALAACSSAATRGRVVTTKTKVEVLSRVEFEPGGIEFRGGARDTLDAIVRTLIGNPDIHAVEIQSHSAACGPSALELTSQRAAAVVAYIEKHDVPARLTAAGYGCTQPIIMNASEADQAKNERIEFLILERSP